MKNARNYNLKPIEFHRPDSAALITLVLLLMLSSGPAVFGQTAGQWVSQGRQFLTVHDMYNARNAFRQAVLVDFNHQEGNLLYALTCIVIIPTGDGPAAFKSLLNGFGVSPGSVQDSSSRSARKLIRGLM